MRINKKHCFLLLMLSIIFILAIGMTSATEITNQTISVDKSNQTISTYDVVKDNTQSIENKTIQQVKNNKTTKTLNNYIYVNSKANSNNNGTESNETTTLTKAIENLQENQVIYLIANTTSDTYKFSEQINIRGWDRTAKNITIIGEKGKTITFDGQSKSSLFNINDISLTLINIRLINSKSYSGAITASNSNITLNNCTITNNNPKINTAIINAYSSNTKINNTIIEKNTIQGNTGLIYISNGEIEITNSIIKNNDMKDNGVLVTRNAKVTIKNSVFDNNKAGKNSAIINSKDQSVSIQKTNFTNNHGNTSGAIQLENTTTSITSSIFINNTSESIGGAITQLGNKTLKITKSTFTQNTAKYDGGSIYSIQSSVNIDSSKFTQNTASNGGALYLGNNIHYGTLKIENSLFTNNQAANSGDIIWTNYNITATNNAFISTRKNNWITLDTNCIINLNTNWWSTNAPNFNTITNGYIPKNWRLMTITNKTSGNTNTLTVSLNKLSDSTTTTSNLITRTAKFTSDSGSFKNTSMTITSNITNTYTGNSTKVNVKIDNQQLTVNNKIDTYLSINNISTSTGSKITFNITANPNINDKVTIKVNNATLTATLKNGKQTVTYAIPKTWNANNYTTTLTFNGNSIYNKKTVTGYLNVRDSTLNIVVIPVNSSDIKPANTTLPSSYDLRNLSLISGVKVQGGSGSCWAFTSLASLESVLLRKTGIEYDFSENNMKNTLKRYSIIGDSQSLPNSGNNDYEPMGYLVGWYGPVNETADKYDSNSIVSPVLDSSFHVQDIYIIPERTSQTDNYLIKQAIMNYGAVSTGIYLSSTTNSYNIGRTINHGVTIVGWDDKYSRNNFGSIPPGDGAFIVKNSWGNSSGDDGYHYVSYYDDTIGSLCNVNDSLNEQLNYVVLMENDDNYTSIYQYDTVVNALQTYNNYVCYKNVFTANNDENIAAIGSYFLQESKYKIELYVNGKLVQSQNGVISLPGYRTIRLNKYVQVSDGDEFTAIIRINRTKTGHNYVLVGYTDLYYSTITDNRTFVSLGEDEDWMDLYEYECVAPLKVYTKDVPYVNSSVKQNDNDIVTVTTQISNIQSSGKITYLLNGEEIKQNDKVVSKSVNKNQVISTTFSDSINLRKYVITVVYTSENYQVRQNITMNNTKLKTTKITLSTYKSQYIGNMITINGTLSSSNVKLAKTNVTITVNSEKFNVQTDSNGKYNLKYTIKTIGSNKITVTYNGNKTYEKTNTTTTFTAVKKPTSITVNRIANQYYNNTVNISGKLLSLNNPITNAKVSILINGTTYNVTTDSTGTYKYSYRIVGVSNITVKVSYAGNNTFASVNNSTSFASMKLNTAITVVGTKDGYVGESIVLSGKLTSSKGVPLKQTRIKLKINSNTYTLTTDNNGTYKYTYKITANGINNITVSYDGNVNYISSSKTAKFSAYKKNTILSVNNFTKQNKMLNITTITGTLKDSSNKAISNANIIITINNISNTVKTNNDGIYTFTHKYSTVGKNNISIYYAGNTQYNPSKKYDYTVQVTKRNVELTILPLSSIVGEQFTLKATVIDEYGQKVDGGNIVFKINGVTLKSSGTFNSTVSTPFKLSVKNGLVQYNMTATKFIRSAKNLTGSYSGSSNYEATTTKTSTPAEIQLRHAGVVVTTSTKQVKQNTNVTFIATIRDITPQAKASNSLINDNAYVMFKVNGVTLKDSKGKVIQVKVTNNVARYSYHVASGTGGIDKTGKVRNYNVTAVYVNPSYYPNDSARNNTTYQVVRSKISLNVQSLVINKTKKTLSVKAKIVDYLGDNVIGASKFCIKLNGKTLKDSKGNAIYYTITNGVIDLSNVILPNVKSYGNVTIVIGAKQGYLGLSQLITKLTLV